MEPWFWILVGVAITIAAAGLIYLAAFAFASWRREARDATARERIYVSTKYDG